MAIETKKNRPKRRTGSVVLRALLKQDLFARIRSDEELASLAREAFTRFPNPYSTLLSHLLGASLQISEEAARGFWLEAVDHRRQLAATLGRPVHLRVATMDLLSMGRALPTGRSLLVAEPLLEELLEVASTDGLTGLLRREHFLLLVGHELRRRFASPPIVAFLDIDNFKQVNDRHGHVRGDALLATVGELWSCYARRGDIMARMGGDEFAALFSETSVRQVQTVMRRFRKRFATAASGLGVGVSVGLAAARKNDSAETLIQRADAVMYRVKGRRRTPTVRRVPGLRERPVGIYATGDPDRFLALHGQSAAWGCLLFPATDHRTLSSLALMVAPRLLLVDEEIVRTTRTDLLGLLRARHPKARIGMFESGVGGQRSSRRDGVERLGWPPLRRDLELTLRAAFGRRLPSLTPLAGCEGMLQLAAAVSALIEGRPVQAEPADRSPDRPEIDLLRGLLGS